MVSVKLLDHFAKNAAPHFPPNKWKDYPPYCPTPTSKAVLVSLNQSFALQFFCTQLKDFEFAPTNILKISLIGALLSSSNVSHP